MSSDAVDKAAIDFCCHQAIDFQVTPAAWDEIKRQTKAFHTPGVLKQTVRLDLS